MTALIRTLVVTGVLAGLVIAGYVQLRDRDHARAIEELEQLNRAMAAKIEAREAMIDRLSRSRRLAHLVVGDQQMAADGSVERMVIG